MKITKREESLLLRSKLALLVDLDQTLIDSLKVEPDDGIQGEGMEQLIVQKKDGGIKHKHMFLRPGTREFLESISHNYDLYVCTKSKQGHAQAVTRFIDPHGKYFAERIYTRRYCTGETKLSVLERLFQSNENPLVVIIDDNAEKWPGVKQLIHVPRYQCFDFLKPEKNRNTDSSEPMINPDLPKPIIVSRMEDNYLYFLANKLNTIHENFYQAYNKTRRPLSSMKMNEVQPAPTTVLKKSSDVNSVIVTHRRPIPNLADLIHSSPIQPLPPTSADCLHVESTTKCERKTRSGRTIKLPARFHPYDLSTH